MDSESIFEDGLLSLFDHYPVALSTAGPSDPFLYRPAPIPTARRGSLVNSHHDNQPHHPSHDWSDLQLSIYLPVAPSALHTTLQLTHLWLSSVLMADLVLSPLATGPRIDVAGKRVCELGAGAGLPSIAAILGGAKQVVVTDYAVPETTTASTAVGDQGQRADPENVLGVLRDNVARGAAEHEQRSKVDPQQFQEPVVWSVVGHIWGQDVLPLISAASMSRDTSTTSPSTSSGLFDTLLLADLLWSTSGHTDLITSILGLLLPHTGVAHTIAGLHQGRGPTERFQRLWLKTAPGGWVKEVGEFRYGKDGWERYERGPTVGDGGFEEERGVVVWFEIGWGPQR